MQLKNIEIELRGPITKEKISEVEAIFERNGKFVEERERILIDYTEFQPHGSIEERTCDVRLRQTNGIPEIIVKLGRWGGIESRKELSICARPGEFDTLVQIFGAIGLKKGVLCVRKSRIWEYKDIEFAFVEVPKHSCYFEAEKKVGNKNEIKAVQGEIRAVCHDLGFEIFDDKGFYHYIESLNREANEIFDFDVYREGYFKERFGC